MFSLFRRSKTRETIERLYGAIVAQSRRAVFYTDFGVPDTIEGRFEMVLLHTILVCHRLKDGGEAERTLSQQVFDTFVSDMDRTLREMGVGDLGVPKRMKKIGAAFYGRAAAYDEALAQADDAELAAALARNILERDLAAPEVAALTDYVRGAARALLAVPFETLERGELTLPTPEPREG
ncbi:MULTISPECIES: ubiquinol-cytochrome C chaperone family protein [unclassified Xanthobacter]|uniref:ubiquinol-cytochrome C chaperone family protein n=1 Tax=unclassified Xanthobacter TaxID=2623496 RepID=UPI001EDFF43D|nr:MULTISPECIES: ubiquinol-cytochrome C chaperone family protein [unclassified Xanthobacter]